MEINVFPSTINAEDVALLKSFFVRVYRSFLGQQHEAEIIHRKMRHREGSLWFFPRSSTVLIHRNGFSSH